jgi:hypothetical protein
MRAVKRLECEVQNYPRWREVTPGTGCCIWTAWIIPIHPSDWTRALFYTDPVFVAPILLPQELTTGPG